MTPLRDYLIIRVDEAKAKTDSGLLLTYEWKKLPHSGEVLAIGPDVTQVEVGDHVYFNRYAFQKISEDEFVGIEKNVVFKYETK